MPNSAGGFNRRANRYRRLGVGTAGPTDPVDPPPAGAPTAPSPVTAATPASKIVGWGGPTHAYESPANYTTWKSWGFDGHAARMANNFLYGYGNGSQSKGSTAAADSDSSWNYQKAFEGLSSPAVNGGATGLGVFKARQNGILSWAGLNTKLTQNTYTTSWGGPSTTTPPAGRTGTTKTSGAPYAQWWDDTVWADVCTKIGSRAAFVHFMGGDGLVFDPEDNGKSYWDTGTGYFIQSATKYDDYGIPTGGHTRAQQNTQIEQRGFEFGTAIYTAFPNCDIVMYQWQDIENSWQAKQGIDVLARLGHLNYYAPNSPSNRSLFNYGIMRAHTAANSTGKWIIADAWWYRLRSQYSGVSTDTALKWDTQGDLSTLSRTLPAATRNHTLPYIGVSPMSWAGTDGTTNYDASQETQPTWTNAQNTYRQRGMLGIRVEYTLEGAPNLANSGINTGHDNYNFVTGRVAAWQASRSTTDNYSNVAPVVAASKSGTGTTRTLTGTASHPLGIHYVKAYIYPSGSSVVATMTWNLGGGSALTNIDNAYMDWTLSLTGVTTGDYAIVTAYSIQNQQKSVVVAL